jgi:inosose dehydratase
MMVRSPPIRRQPWPRDEQLTDASCDRSSPGGGGVSFRIATAPVSWGIWEQTIDRDDLIPPETFLQTIVELGYTATETGPPGYFAPDGRTAVERARRHGVDLIATFLPLRLDVADGFEDDLGALDRTVEVLEATGGGIVLLAAMETPARARAAGSDERRWATAWDAETVERAA